MPLIRLLASGGLASEIAKAGQDPLEKAIENDRADIVELLLNAGGDPNAVASGGEPPVELALSLDHGEDIMRLLLRAGANLKTHSWRYAHSPLDWAITKGYGTGMLKEMIAHGADWREEDRGSGLLYEAVRVHNRQAAQLLIDLGADTVQLDEDDLRELNRR